MTDLFEVRNKARVPLSESRDISVILLENPTGDPVTCYRTAIDPALVLDKSRLNPISNMRVLDENHVPITIYQTELDPAEVLHKRTLHSGGSVSIIVGDGPWVDDLGAVTDLEQPEEQSISDWWHKTHVTDLAPDDVTIIPSATFDLPNYSPDNRSAQFVLYPVSSRHLVKTSDGTLHAICNYKIAGRHRVVYLKSVDGGEHWTSEIVDSDEAFVEYINPSITVDKNDGIHITYSKWDGVLDYTYWLFSGSSTPAGFTLVSGVGGNANQRILTGGTGAYSPDLSANNHSHSYSYWGGASIGATNMGYDVGLYYTYVALHGYHHSSFGPVSLSLASRLPPYRSMKILKYPGIPPSLPADIVIPFTNAVPAGFSRYSDQDGYYIFGSDTVGTLGGSATNYHTFSGTFAAADGCLTCEMEMYPSYTFAGCGHTHPFSINSSPSSHIPPSYNTILGLVTSPITTLPANSIILSASVLSSLFSTDLSSSGILSNKCIVGNNSYSDAGGSTTHIHDNFSGNTGPAVGSAGMDYYEYPWSGHAWISNTDHYHGVGVTDVEATSNYPAYFAPYFMQVNSDLDLSLFGKDVFYRYKPKEGAWSVPVNISDLHSLYPSFESTVLCDPDDHPHIVAACGNVNIAHANYSTICHWEKDGAWGAREDLSADDIDARYPSLDVDKNDAVHVAWFDFTNFSSIQYINNVGGTWNAIEKIVGGNGNYVGFPGNLLLDANGVPHLFYKKWSDPDTKIGDVYYSNRIGGAWSAPVNFSPGKSAAGYNQTAGQSSFDNQGGLVCTWTGKGYGLYTGMYHPVYRYISKDGTITPPLGEDAIDLF